MNDGRFKPATHTGASKVCILLEDVCVVALVL